MAGKQAFQRDKTLDAKDYTMTSMNALTTAVATYGYELELSKVTGEVMPEPQKRIPELADFYFELHINRVPGNVPAVLPGSSVVATTPNTEGDPGAVVIEFGKKYPGKTFAEVYDKDDSYVEWMANSMQPTNDVGRKAQADAKAFLASL